MIINLHYFRYRFLLVYVWTSLLYIGYQLTNHFHWFTPQYLPLTALEQAIPFLVWTVIPYLILILGMYLFAFIDNRDDFFESLIAFTVAVCMNYTIYMIFPTTYERPVTPTDDGFSFAVYRWLVSIDTPANCWPSGHIATSALGCWYLARHHKRLRIPLLAFFSILSLSVLTTKQHYLIDIPGGMLTALVGILVAKKLSQSNKLKTSRLYRNWKSPV